MVSPAGFGAHREHSADGTRTPQPAHLDVVAIADRPWAEAGNRTQHLLTALLHDRPEARVLLVGPAVHRWRSLREGRRPHLGRGLRPVVGVPGLGAAQLWSLALTPSRPASSHAGAHSAVAEDVEAAARKIGLVQPVLFVGATYGAEVLAATGWPTCYDIPVKARIATRTADEQERLAADEAFLLAEAEVVLACSAPLARVAGTRRHVTVLPNAAHPGHLLSPARRPPDLPNGRVALVLGTVTPEALDLDLCAATARATAGTATVVMLGKVAVPAADRRRLRRSGVVLLGARPYRDVPGYLQHADVLLAPYATHAFADQLDPVALYEYQAVGTPVVGTPVSACRERANVAVAGADAFVGTVLAGLHNPSATQPVPVPLWRDRGGELARLLTELAGTSEQPATNHP